MCRYYYQSRFLPAGGHEIRPKAKFFSRMMCSSENRRVVFKEETKGTSDRKSRGGSRVAVLLEDVAPALGDLRARLVAEIRVAVRLVALVLLEIALHLRPYRLEAIQAERFVKRAHLPDRVADQVLVAQLVEAAGRNHLLPL